MRKLATLALIAGALASPARAGIIISQNNDPTAGRATFSSLLTANSSSTIVDTGNAFAADPSATTGLANFTRSGTIGGQSYGYTAYDIGFSSAPTGSLTPGTVGGDIVNISTIAVDTPATQDGATGSGTWGLDSGSVSASTHAAILLDFTDTPGGQGIGHFAADLIDWEASSLFTNAEIRLYKGGVLTFSQVFNWDPLSGSSEVHFLGILATDTASFFDQVVIVIGDDGPGSGFTEQWALDRMTFGQGYAEALAVAPEPSSLALAGIGAAATGIATFARRRRRGA